MMGLTWSYGVTTVPGRQGDLLPRTLKSLAAAGFDKPRLFVDGAEHPDGYLDFGLPLTLRYPTIRTMGNFALGLWELYTREPNAQRYAMFQDDFVTYRNLRQYLDAVKYPAQGYCNLYTFPRNLKIATQKGWNLSDQLGKGAVALVFSRDALVNLLTHSHFAKRVQGPNGHKSIDGGICQAMTTSGWAEYTHNPTLVQHTGLKSSMGNREQPLADSFLGEDFDAMDLLKC
jgi:hypothetical protein